MHDTKKLEEFAEFKKKSDEAIRGTFFSIKTQMSETNRNFLMEYLKFPGSLGIISLFITNSDIISYQSMAILGSFLIIISLFLILYLFVIGLDEDTEFYKNIINIESKLGDFGSKFVTYTRNPNSENYRNLEESYQKNVDFYENEYISPDHKRFIKNLDFSRKVIRFSFYLLVIGVILIFIAVI